MRNMGSKQAVAAQGAGRSRKEQELQEVNTGSSAAPHVWGGGSTAILVRRRMNSGKVCLLGVILYRNSCPAGERVRGPPV